MAPFSKHLASSSSDCGSNSEKQFLTVISETNPGGLHENQNFIFRRTRPQRVRLFAFTKYNAKPEPRAAGFDEPGLGQLRSHRRLWAEGWGRAGDCAPRAGERRVRD